MSLLDFRQGGRSYLHVVPMKERTGDRFYPPHRMVRGI